jgi:UDP-N-acetylenolpyruvoylglucosamine reductase
MNAGAMGGWIFDVVDEVRLMSMDGVVSEVPRSSHDVDYRHCAELHDAIALGAVMRPMAATDGASVARQIDEYRRSATSPSRGSPARAASSRIPRGTPPAG